MRKSIVLALAFIVIAAFSLVVWLISNEPSPIGGSAFEDQPVDTAEPSLESLMGRGELALEDGEWQEADEFFIRVLDINPEHAPAYLGRLLAELKIKNEAGLANHEKPLDNILNFQRTLRFADARLRARMEGYNQRIRELERQLIAEKPRQVGDIIQFGGYEWRVLDVQNNSALIITESIIERHPYNVQYTDVTWEICDLRKYLNAEFLQKFSREDQAQIAETRVNNQNNQPYGTNGGNDTNDKIFLLSIEEAEKYFRSDSSRRAMNTDGASMWWWLRSPGNISYNAALVLRIGLVNVVGSHVNNDAGGVRPVLWLNL